MARVLGVDVGARVGFGLISPEEVLSSSYQFLADWYPLGRSCREWRRRAKEQVQEYRPDHIGIARQFVRRHDTPKNLIPMYWAFATVLEIADELGIQAHWIVEARARELFLGTGNVPNTSDKLKLAVHQACRDRCWVCTDHNAADGLCIANAVMEKLFPGTSHAMTPLFLGRT